MFAGWVCLGGTEIVNNERAIGYASTASQLTNEWGLPSDWSPEFVIAENMVMNPSFETAGPSATMLTNLATNPSFETSAGSQVARRNLIQNSDTSSAAGWTTTSGTVASVGGRLQYTQNTVNPARLGGTTPLSALKPAGSYVGSYRAQAMDPTLTGVRIYLVDTTSSSAVRATGTAAVIAGGADNQYEFSLTASGAFDRVYMEFFGSGIPNGAVGYISQPILEAGSATGRSWFNGSTQSVPDSDLTATWTGTAGSSESVLSGAGVAVPVAGLSFGSDGFVVNVQSGQWAASRARSWRQIPLGASRSTYSYINLTGAPFVVGRTYTVLVTFRQAVVQSSSDPAARRLAYMEGGVAVQQAIAANTTAPQQLRITFTLGASGTRLIRFEGAMPAVGVATQSTWWDDLLIIEGAYTGPYFDGSTTQPDPDFATAWSGASDASTSLVSAQTVARTTGGNAVVARSQEWVESGAFSARIIPTTAAASTTMLVGSMDGTYGYTLEAGRTYTLLATRHLDAPLTGALTNYAGRAALVQTGAATLYSDALPNEAGDGDIRWTFTVDPAVTAATLRLGHGGAQGSGDVWWDNLLVVEGQYNGSYFDGSTPAIATEFYRWTGPANDSPSQRVGNEVPAVWPNYCDITWFTGEGACPPLFDVLNRTWFVDAEPALTWEAQNILEDAPWASDSVYEPAEKFLGIFALSISELSDSSRGLTITQGITDGGVLGRSRLAVPTFRFRVMLTAVDEDGLEYGTAWLSRALAEQSCGSHGPSCGSTDLTFFDACPPPPEVFFTSQGREDPDISYDLMTRTYHDVKCINGPVVVQELRSKPNSYGRIVEFTLAAGVPSLFGLMGIQTGSVDASTARIFADVPRNAIPTPSAELPGADVTVGTNYSTNPSVETNATGWATAVDGTAITAGMVTSGRVTGELAAVGAASFRAVFTATGASAVPGWFACQQEVTISGRPAGAPVSFNMWAAELLMAGVPARTDITFIAIWRNAGVEISRDTIGSVPTNGGSASARSLTPPAGATSVIVRAQANLTSWPAGTVLRLYADALLVSVP